MSASAQLPVISVVTVVYNGAAYLRQAIESVLGQNYPNLDYVIIDGGSTDGSLDIIDEYKNRLGYFISEPDQGISDAFNKGISAAKGELIGILNADDWYEPDTLNKVAQAFLNGQADIIHGNQQYWTTVHGNTERDYIFSAKQELLPKEMTINHPTCFVRKAVYEQHGTFRTDMKYAMDYELMLRFWLAGARFQYLNHTLANMRLAGASDQHWRMAYVESYRAKRLNGISWGTAYPYYMKMVLRTTVARTLPKLGLGSVLAWFRRNFALTAKTK